MKNKCRPSRVTRWVGKRTNIRDPKEITVLLVSLAIGLGTGVGRWDLAVVLTLFTLILLWILEKREPEQVFRPMNLKVSTRDVESTRVALKKVLEGHTLIPNFEQSMARKEMTQGL